MNPLVSIIIPTYNRPSLLAATLGSVLEQEYKHWECLVIDDGSSREVIDQAEDICLKDSRIKFFNRPNHCNQGASACRNYGFSKAQGELIQFLDDDDLLDKRKLAEQVKLYTRNDHLTLFTGQWGGFTDDKDLKSRFKFSYHSYRNFKKGAGLLSTFGLYNEYFPVNVYLTPRPLMEKAGLWNEDLNNNDDAEFFTRVILNSKKIIFTSGSRVYYRYSSPGKLSDLNSEKKIQSVLKSWNLIEEHIRNSNSSQAKKYYKRAKDNLFRFFEKERPDILSTRPEFFEARSDYSSRYYRSKNRLRKILKRLV
ncbi:glycosyltransferase [Salinimicrobium sp. HB62]|uniref:glycosyltransferase n=1 Tax=Salinimicrobium sp. HB62 TaxID=3077781 RepID=UPI002D795F25|nr:glycosyltransferase [Salinimicrobium sp. HB62]